MKTDEIVKLSRKAVSELVRTRMVKTAVLHTGDERRRAPRWPFPGKVEIRIAGDDLTPPCFADCRDISDTGLGMKGDRAFEPQTRLDIAIHLPEATFFGEATVRYCMRTPQGHMIGVEFNFDQ